MATSSTATLSPLSIETLIKLIPEFDTAQNLQVYRFIRSCNAAFQLASETDKTILLIYTLNKIVGPFAADVHAKQFTTWNVLQSYLIEKFSNVKTIAHLSLELQSMFQKPSESVTDYYHRVDLLRSKIIEKLQTEVNDESLVGRKLGIEETALNVFVNGLDSDLGAMLRTKEFKHLSNAGRFAIQEDKIRAMNTARQQLFKASLQLHNKPTNPRPPPPPRPLAPKPYQPNQTASQPPQPRFQEQKFCNYCKNIGHIISECRKRAFNNNKFRQNNQAPKPLTVNHLNSHAATEPGNSMETALALYPSTQSNQTQSSELETIIDFQKLQLE